MGMVRCPQCDAPMTDEEASAGACLMCGAELEKKKPEPKQAPKRKQEHTSPGLIMSLLFAVGGTLLFCFLPIGIMIYYSLPERTEEKKSAADEAKKEPRAEVKKQPAPVSVPEKKPDTEVQPKEEKKEEKKPDASLDEEKKPEEKKIEVKPKLEEKKPDVPKVKEAPLPGPKARFVSLPLLQEHAIKIDGDLADWKDVPPIVLTALARGRETKKPIDDIPKTMNAYAAWCSKGILIAAEVVDTSGVLENAGKPEKGMWPFWDNDNIEIFIDTLNLRANKRGALHEHQFFALPFGAPGEEGRGGYESRIIKQAWSLHAFAHEVMPSAGKKTPNGWTIEMLIPMSALRKADLKAGHVIGLEVQIDTGTNVFYHWINDDQRLRSSDAPHSWGEAILAGSDAKIEFLDRALNRIQALESGRELGVRIIDADANQDPGKKDRLNVVLVGKAGRLPLLLEETAPNSGVFVGQIETQRNAPHRAGIFGVTVGEVMTVEYLDPINAKSERNKKVVAELPCR